MKFLFVILYLINVVDVFSQEAMINDIKACKHIYLIKSDLIKQIQREKDTINYFHDEELVIFYNRTKTKVLSPNAFYIINHGFNKLITMNVLFIMVEFTDSKRHKDTLISNPSHLFEILHQDSLASGTYTKVTFNINNSQYKKAVIKSYFIEIKYYQKTIYRWFLKENDLGNLFPRSRNIVRPT
jgi:hypothetical protein